jgi:hypothetical protein
MNLRNVLLFLSLVSAAVGFNAYAVDPSICDSGTRIVFNDNGSLRSCGLNDDYEANGIRCSKGRVNFYDNGNLESCMLSRPATIDKNKCDQFGLISFYPDGKLKSCMKPAN